VPPPSRRSGPASEAGQGAAPDEETRIKGDSLRGPRLLVYRRRGREGGAERLASGARAAPGDLLQLAYAAGDAGLHGVLLSIDGAGRVTQHLPEEGARLAPALPAPREIKLPSAYQLDDAPGFERFVLVTAPEPFPVATVLGAARELAAQGEAARARPLALPAAFRQTSVVLDKSSQGAP
jgi:hypothetical protein